MDEYRVRGCADADMAFGPMSKHLVVKILDTDWAAVADTHSGVYPLTPVYRVWARGEAGETKVRCFGLLVAPNFAEAATALPTPH